MKRLLATTVCLACLAGASCGQGSTDADPASAQRSAAPAQDENVVEVTMSEFAFTVEGDARPGRLLVNFTNDGEQIHDAVIAKLEEGKTLEDVQNLLKAGPSGPPPPWVNDTPPDTAYVGPGETAGVVVDAEEGTYVMLCFVSDPKGVPHAAHGMVQAFEVTGAPVTTELDADHTIAMTNDGVEPRELGSGPSIVNVTNDAGVPGEIAVVQFEDGRAWADLEKWFASGGKGAAPATFHGGTHAIAPGASVDLALDLEPGTYTFMTSFGEGEGYDDIPTEVTVSD